MGRKRKGRRVDKSMVMGSLVRVYTNEGRYPIIEGRFRAAVFLTIAEVYLWGFSNENHKRLKL